MPCQPNELDCNTQSASSHTTPVRTNEVWRPNETPEVSARAFLMVSSHLMITPTIVVTDTGWVCAATQMKKST